MEPNLSLTIRPDSYKLNGMVKGVYWKSLKYSRQSCRTFTSLFCSEIVGERKGERYQINHKERGRGERDNGSKKRGGENGDGGRGEKNGRERGPLEQCLVQGTLTKWETLF